MAATFTVSFRGFVILQAIFLFSSPGLLQIFDLLQSTNCWRDDPGAMLEGIHFGRQELNPKTSTFSLLGHPKMWWKVRESPQKRYSNLCSSSSRCWFHRIVRFYPLLEKKMIQFWGAYFFSKGLNSPTSSFVAHEVNLQMKLWYHPPSDGIPTSETGKIVCSEKGYQKLPKLPKLHT